MHIVGHPRDAAAQLHLPARSRLGAAGTSSSRSAPTSSPPGLVLIVLNLLVSRFRGPAAGNDPFGGDTLEWSISSPPPPYNYAVIPTVTSAYPMWDKEDRKADSRRLDRGEGLLGARARDAGDDRPGRGARRDPRDAAALGLAAGDGADAGGGVRDAADAPLLDRRSASPSPAGWRCWHGTARGWRSDGGIAPWQPSPAAAAAPPPSRGRGSRKPSGWWGMALFLCAEATLFGILIATYFYLDFDARSWPPRRDHAAERGAAAGRDRGARLDHDPAAVRGPGVSAAPAPAGRGAGDRRGIVVQSCYLGGPDSPVPSRPAPVLAQGDRLRVDLLHAARPPITRTCARDPARTGRAVAGRGARG